MYAVFFPISFILAGLNSHVSCGFKSGCRRKTPETGVSISKDRKCGSIPKPLFSPHFCNYRTCLDWKGKSRGTFRGDEGREKAEQKKLEMGGI